jgi:2,3-bisphosphoglycerate-independent phosphoglycerate mutase
VGFLFKLNLHPNLLNAPFRRHLNIGAGRIVWQDIVRIDVTIKKRQFHQNATIVESCKHAKNGTGRLHLIGLVGQHLFFLLLIFEIPS